MATRPPGTNGTWWGLWIVGNILTNGSLRMTSYGADDSITIAIALSVVAGAMLIACAFLLRTIIREITAAQNTEMNMRAVFE